MRNRSVVWPAAGRPLPALAAAVLALACGHTEPFASPPYGSEAPFDPSPPRRLTFNPAADRAPAWLADGSGLVYSAQQVDRPDNDVCLAVLPPTGGSQRALHCDFPGGETRTDAIESAAPGPTGWLAFVSASGTLGASGSSSEGIALGPSLDPRNAAMVRAFPVTPEGSTPQNSAEYLRWLDQTRLVWVGQQVRVRAECSLCPLDTLRLPQAVTVFDASQPGSAATAVPFTDGATGVGAGPAGDMVYYTIRGDTRIFRHTLSTGGAIVVFDYGAAGIVRDVHAAGNRLAAIVGGRIAYVTDPQFGPMHVDSGGVVHVLDLNTMEDLALDGGDRLFRRPALSPAGDALVAEGYELILTPLPDAVPFRVDTSVSRSGDIYLFGAP